MRKLVGIMLAVCMICLSGCSMAGSRQIKLRDLEFTVLGEEKIPEELKSILEEKKTAPFQITYTDNEYLYLCVGYGEQETGGYCIAVEELYLTETNVFVNTVLLGPEASEKNNKTPSYPYLVLKTEFLEVPVHFQ